MNEPTPELNREPQVSEKEAAQELLAAKEAETVQGIPFRPDYEQARIQAGVDAIIKPASAEVTTPVEGHREAGIHLPNEIKTEKEKQDRVNEMIFSSKATGFEMTEELKRLTDKAA